MTDIEKELKKLGVTYDGYSVLQNKNGITVARISDGEKSYILKHKRVELSTVLKSPLFAATASKSLARDSIASFFSLYRQKYDILKLRSTQKALVFA